MAFFQNQNFQEKLSVSSKFSPFFIGNKYFVLLFVFFFLPPCTLLPFASECNVKTNVEGLFTPEIFFKIFFLCFLGGFVCLFLSFEKISM